MRAADSRASREARLDMVVACEQSLGREPPENSKNRQIVLVKLLTEVKVVMVMSGTVLDQSLLVVSARAGCHNLTYSCS